LRGAAANVNIDDLPEWAKPEVTGSLAGTEWDISVEEDEDEVIDYKYKFFEDGKFWVAGGAAGEGVDGNYQQAEDLVYLAVGGFKWTGKYDGKQFSVSEDESPSYPGFYEEEIKRVTMLGDDEDLEWVISPQGLVIKTPEKKGKYAYSFKIERYHHPKLKK